MMLLPVLSVFLLVWFQSGSEASSCSLCYDLNISPCYDKRRVSLDIIHSRNRTSELQISYNYIPHLTNNMFQYMGFIKLKRIVCKQCGINHVEPETFQGVQKLMFLHLNSNNIQQLHPDTFSSAQKLIILDLSDNKLSYITSLHTIPTLKYLFLSDNFISTLPNETFCYHQETCGLITLDISNNLVSHIESYAFKGLQLLQELNLAQNNIVHLHEDTFTDTLLLYKLLLQENRISRLDFIKKVHWLKILDISQNNISILSNNMFSITNTSDITDLNLSNNRISNIELFAFQKLENLRILDLSDNQIDYAHAKLFEETPKLEVLKLNNNHISVLDFIASIKKLRSVYLLNNRLISFNARTFSQSTLDTIDVSNNNIVTVQENSLAGIKKLFQLNLFGNNITFIPSKTFQRVHLYDLNLKHNRLAQLNFVLNGKSFHNLQLQNNNISRLPIEIIFKSGTFEINEFSLSNNGITSIKFETFKRLRQMKSLNLSKNNILIIPQGSFQSATSLNVLNLKYNQISELNFVKTCFSLKYLHLESNKILTLLNETFIDSNNQESKLETIDLENNEINIIEDRAFYGTPHLKELNLSRNRITTINSGILQNTTRLWELNLNYNLISQIDFVPFIPNLRRIYISNNDISVLPPNAFSNTNYSNLFYINLADNEITTIDETSFSGLKELTVLNLSGNNITYIFPRTFAQVNHLKSLDLSRNNISEIYIFHNMPWLKSCDLSNNIISVLPNQMFSSSNSSKLCKLKLANNRITTIEYHAFSGLLLLKDLDLSGNNITIIHPQTFVFFKSLLKLDLSNNKIYHPYFIQNMPLLRHLHLADNNIHILQNNTFSTSLMPQLIHLNLTHNGIFKVETQALQGLQTLKYLDISRNSISRLPNNVFENNSMLSGIDLSNNGLSHVEFVLDLPNLQFCNLSSNQIWTLTNNSFSTSNFNRLKYIDLSNNKIVLIEHRAFQSLPKLEHLDLSANNMTYFYSDILEHSRKLKTLDLRNNPTNRASKETVDLYKLSNNDLKDIMLHFKIVWNQNGPVTRDLQS